MRPSILTAALDEPVMGWTDTVNFMSGITQLIGLGILTQMPCKQDAFVDIVPVDVVTKQMLVSIPYYIQVYRESKNQQHFFITSCSTSSLNPIQWRSFFDYMIQYQHMFPYDKRAGPAQLTLHETEAQYQLAYKMKSKYPA